MRKSLSMFVISAAASAALAGSVARGAMMTQSGTLPSGEIASGGSSISDPITATFTGFNPSLGTLTGVSLNFYYDITAVVTGPPGGGGVQTSGPFQVDGNQLTMGGVAQGTGAGSGGLLPGSFNYDVAFSNVGPDNSPSTFSTGYTVGFAANSSLSGAPNNSLEIDLASDSAVTATYTYTPAAVPEPASVGLLAIGSLGLLARRRTVGRSASEAA